VRQDQETMISRLRGLRRTGADADRRWDSREVYFALKQARLEGDG